MREIRSKDNKIWKRCEQLTMRKYRDRSGLYLIEGENLLDEAIRNHVRIETVLVREDCQKALPPEAAEGLEKCLKEHGEAYIPGALTDSMVVPLLRSGLLRGGRLVVADPSKVILKPDTLDKLAVREVSLQTKDAARTLCVTVNPVSAYGWKFDKDVFIDRMRQSVKVPVINVKEELA